MFTPNSLQGVGSQLPLWTSTFSEHYSTPRPVAGGRWILRHPLQEDLAGRECAVLPAVPRYFPTVSLYRSLLEATWKKSYMAKADSLAVWRSTLTSYRVGVPVVRLCSLSSPK